MEKRGGRPPTASSFDQDPEFFQIFLPDRISHQLCIPPDFVKHFDQRMPEAVVLRDLSGRAWHVDLKQEKDGVFLKNGWNRFVNDKSLMLGELMVFRYHRRPASFTVRIFGKNACKKDEYQDSKRPFNHVKEDQELDQDSSPIHKSSKNPKRTTKYHRRAT